MIIDILTLFPKFYESPISMGIINMAINEKKINLNIEDMRVYGEGNYKKCDDYPYGGGPGMIMTYNIFKNILKVIKEDTLLFFLLQEKLLLKKK